MDDAADRDQRAVTPYPVNDEQEPAGSCCEPDAVSITSCHVTLRHVSWHGMARGVWDGVEKESHSGARDEDEVDDDKDGFVRTDRVNQIESSHFSSNLLISISTSLD